MFWRSFTTFALIGALSVGSTTDVRADAGDFIGGAIVGGLIGHAITKDQQKRRTVTRTQTYRPAIPITEHGRQTQVALNYFGYQAGSVDGQIGPGTRRAIERYQVSMGYPVNGRDFQPYQFDFLMDAYYWATNGGQVQTRLVGQPLLMAYRQQMQTQTAYAVQPQAAPLALQPGQVTTVVVPAPAAPAAPAAAPAVPTVAASAEPESKSQSSLPNLFAGSAPSVSLANRCNAVMLQTSTNGGYTTLASMTDPEFTLSEQFCLARSYAIARGEDLMQGIQGLTPKQISEQCNAFGDMLSAQVDAISLRPAAEAEAEMRSFALSTGIPPADLSATSRVCLATGYAQDNMTVALGAALMLVTLGEPAYGELLGHHLREGVGTTARNDLAMQWYEASVSALENGSNPVFMPSQNERPQLLRASMTLLGPEAKQGALTAPAPVQNATLPTFSVQQ
ncbi:peptidoglycan-binding domain-containing protein [Ovoidimarina sediminis]|uniref:peptidoglycan-binding domain-containing protein n=1 Tax=Ovoidimarina sediminis TaxID=3079856 RepID=UPI002909A7B6|nr:peptidoglycan-binding domain-containing protein [Rhodophyticola sp. MJ-SS7]MDU8945200.1 peptidoglycan-binding domain-containing protein [Rhodophyticola sp. MJ-SS7]